MYNLCNLLKTKTFFIVDGILIFSSVIFASYIRLEISIYEAITYHHLLQKAILITIVFQICLYYSNFYDIRSTTSKNELFIRLFQAVGIACIVLACIYYIFSGVVIGRGISLIYVFIILVVLTLWRLAYSYLSQCEILNENVLIIGSGKMARSIAREIKDKGAGFRLIGFVDFVDNKPKGLEENISGTKIIGSIKDLKHIVRKEKVKRLIIAMADRRSILPVDDLITCKLLGISIDDGISFYERITGKIMIENLRPSWLIFSESFKSLKIRNDIKTTVEVFIALILLIILSPLIILISILIKLDSKGEVFYRQERVGRYGMPFNLLKFRSMKSDAEAGSGPIWAKDNDDRVTRVGRILRKTRLDELPQLFNIIRREMSFVGPRPERPFFVEELQKQIPYYSTRHYIRPGITGWAQIKFRYGSSVEDAMEKLQFDLYYIKNMSILLDVSIVIDTAKVVLLGVGAK